MDALGEALQTTVSRWKCKFSAPLPLELYTSSNFIGLFVKEDSAEVLKKFAADFAAEAASKTGKRPWFPRSEVKRAGMGMVVWQSPYQEERIYFGSRSHSSQPVVVAPGLRQNVTVGMHRRTNLLTARRPEGSLQ